ncbi:MAG TPA: VIT1/CCC1 family protein [Caulobacteraceae bacterium]|jgi:VIT1/CCC1 family predicted Fe2+/Mn2+ transporter|nr:VIT1/CCC1 family protein [Caulobacteraceae bacterium]
MPRDEVRRFRDNLQAELDGTAVYDALARAESDPKVAAVYRRLAATEEAHAEFWRSKLRAAGAPPGRDRPSARASTLAWLARRFGPGLVLPVVARAEARDSGHYADQPDAVAAGLDKDERGHARVIAAASAPGGMAGAALASLEGRHRGGGGGNALRASVLGANDGLVSNLSLVMGVAGAAADGRLILLTGVAGLVAGACSMAMGEWLSVTSSRELAQNQIRMEAEELAQSPDDEKRELVLIYQAKGLDEATARRLADQMFRNPETALDALAREELGLDPEGLGGSATAAAGFSFILFAVGAAVPVLPFLFTAGTTAIALSLVVSGVALALVGAGTSLFTGRGMAVSAGRQLAIGFAAAALTYGVGKAIGVSLT